MKVLVTGGGGFLGRRLVGALLERGALTDAAGQRRAISGLAVLGRSGADGIADPRVTVLRGSVADPGTVAAALDGVESVFHLAAVVSAEAEQDFDLGYRVNVEGTRLLLEAARRAPRPVRFVFASSAAVFGGALPALVPEDWAPTPQTSYGTQKAAAELLVNDYTRKGFVDGRSARIGMVVVRPGPANKAASAFGSAIIREPLAGTAYDCPVPPETRVFVTSPAAVVDNLIHAHELPADSFTGGNRIVTLPGLPQTVGALVETLARVAPEAAARVRWAPDPFVTRIAAGWPGAIDTPRALALGFRRDADFDSIVRTYMAEQGIAEQGIALPSGATPGGAP